MDITVAKFARYIMDESPAVADQKKRFTWAENAGRNPGPMAEALMPFVALEDDVAAGAADQATITDVQIQTALEAVRRRFLQHIIRAA